MTYILWEVIVIQVPYRQIFEKYEIAVIPLNDGKFDVQFMPRTSNLGISIEVCDSEHHAVEGAKKFPVFHSMALDKGFHMGQDGFKHNDGRDVHYSYTMDTDMTPKLFTSILERGY